MQVIWVFILNNFDFSAEHKAVFKRSPCAVANTLDIIGDKWTLLIIRDLLLGKRLYSEFAQSPEKISTNILADRLEKLELHGLVIKRAYSDKPLRYEYLLTDKGRELLPILREMIHWAKKHIPYVVTFPKKIRQNAE
jgi:DNA-binding HxlR family transcriptional regulator